MAHPPATSEDNATMNDSRTASEPTESAVVVLIPELDSLVDPWRQRIDPSAPLGVPAHVTLLYPFVAPTRLDQEVLNRVANVIADEPAFTARFQRTGWFVDQVVWIAPEPEEPFRRLTKALVRAFPDHPPYGGAFDDAIPHLTIGEADDVAGLREAEQEVIPALPITSTVATAVLLTGSSLPGSWSTVATFPFASDRA